MEQEAQTRVLDAPPAEPRAASDGAKSKSSVTPRGDEAESASPAGPRGRDLAGARSMSPPPAQVGRYALLRRLAHGGMATVYLGRVHGTAGFEKVVALKLIHPHLASEPDFLEMFFDEARIAARIHHPHVVEILDLGEEQGLHYMAMEWVEGETLAALVRALRPGRLPISVTLQVIADALEGLAAAHKIRDASGRALNLVHRDVSPQNLLISMDGFVKVTDFGIMKAAGRHGSTRTGELRGKVAYMSPEQARGLELDARSDLFAMGVIAWELLHGRRLFAQATDAATLERVIACEVPPIDDEVLRGCSEATSARLRSWVARALSRDPAERFGDAREMLDAVRESLREATERDPRAALAAIMQSEFGERVAYVRASLRGSASGIRPGIPPTGEHPAAISSTSHSVSAGVTEATGFGTPKRAWAALVLLPLLGAGAAVGIAYAAGLLGREPAPAAAEKLTPPPSAQVRWFISTEPEGAQIFVDGEVHEALTPTELLLPKGKGPVTLELVKPGMQTTRATLRPLGDDNLFYRLVAEPVADDDGELSGGEALATAEGGASGAASGPSGEDEGPRTGAIKTKFRPPRDQHSAGSSAGGSGADDGDSADTGADTAKSGGTGLRPMPDFDDDDDEEGAEG